MSAQLNLSLFSRRRVPVVKQTEVAECGLACLAMVAGYHGHNIDLGTLRRRFAVAMTGLSLLDLSHFASGLSLSTRAVRAELDELAKLRTPCILHWKLTHYVVLERIGSKGVYICDPAEGRRWASWQEVSESFTGVALELWPSVGFERKTERKSIRPADLFRRTGGLNRALLQIFLLSLCLEAIALLSPIGSQIIFDEVVVASDHELLTLVAIGMACLVVLQVVFGLARSWAALVMGTSLSVQWTAALFDHMLNLPLAYFEKRHVGDVVSRFGSLGNIQSALTTDVISILMDGIMIIGTLVMMILYGGWMALVACGALTIHLFMRMIAYGPYRAANESAINQEAKEDTHFIETIRGMATIKTLDLRERRRNAWLNLFVNSMNANLRIQKLNLLFGTAGTFLAAADGIATLVIGGHLVIGGSMTVGMLIAFLAYKEQFVSRGQALIEVVINLKMLGLHSERIADIALTSPEEGLAALESPFVRQQLAHSPALSVRNVHLSYGNRLPKVLEGVSLDVAPGECLAIKGPSGCGKTTLLKVMAGLIAPTEGEILLGGRDIRHLGLTNYRRSIATVLQEDQLFAGTISENIAGFDPDPDEAWVEECARMAAIRDEILAMPMRFDSLVGDMGSTLSGGQKQRLFLARALYRRPSILFLDEATSALDEANEKCINQAISQLKISRVIIAHRENTISQASRSINIR